MPTVHKPVLCLASVSPRRRELLAQIGVPHSVAGAHIDEKVMPAESAREYVIRMAREKALAVRAKSEQLPVLAADTTVVLDEVIFGKPKGRADGLAMLGRLSGRTHSVLTAVALLAGGELAVSVSASEVRFRPLSSEVCAA
jgi:septum formation protein